MRLIFKLFCSIGGLIFGLLLASCDIDKKLIGPGNVTLAVFDLSTEQWQKEIQQRFDTINGNGEPVKCIIMKNVRHFPLEVYKTDYNDNYSNHFKLYQYFVKAGLLSEKINIEEQNFKGIKYIYDLTDEGKLYYRTWFPHLHESGFCFGKVLVKSINRITPDYNEVEIEYEYILDNLPPKLASENKVMTDFVRFAYDEKNKQIYSKYGIGLIVEKYTQ